MRSFLDLLTLPRRTFLSGTAVALLAGNDALAADQKNQKAVGTAAADAMILNSALGAELEAIAAYQAASDSGVLDAATKVLAQTFQGQHQEHAQLLAKTIAKLGGKPAAAKSKYDFPIDKQKSQAEVLRFAVSLEQGAVSAYLGAIPQFASRDLSKAAASILGDEAMHLAVLRQALGETPVPSAFVS